MFLFYVLSFFKKGDTIQGGTLFKGGLYLRKYGIRPMTIASRSELSCIELWNVLKYTGPILRVTSPALGSNYLSLDQSGTRSQILPEPNAVTFFSWNYDFNDFHNSALESLYISSETVDEWKLNCESIFGLALLCQGWQLKNDATS